MSLHHKLLLGEACVVILVQNIVLRTVPEYSASQKFRDFALIHWCALSAHELGFLFTEVVCHLHMEAYISCLNTKQLGFLEHASVLRVCQPG